MANPLLSDREVSFQLYEVHGAADLCRLPAFADHGRETFDLFLASARKIAREVLFPAYRPMDAEPPRLEGGRVRVHPAMKEIWPRLVELGMTNATRPAESGGQELPVLVALFAGGYLSAANGAAAAYAGLTAGAAHLVEAFGNDEVRETFHEPMISGRWSGTMALTEPHAGSSLADVRTTATPLPAGRYLVRGNKVFISGGDQDFTENIVHLALGRIEGAPAGIKGISLFAVPRLRPENGRLADNDCSSAGVFHKMGWRGIPSIALNFGERGDCVGWLVGTPHQGLAHMFQMMNEARLMVGMNGVATAMVAYHEALEYARTRPQGRPLAARDPRTPQIPIVEHADVRRMLLKQKAIVEGGLSLLAECARLADLVRHGPEEDRERNRVLLDLLTPVGKSYPAEAGFVANSLAVQVHGGYGYTAEYLPEAWLRDQKLNSIHEGTTGIQSLDLLGRKVVASGGEALRALAAEFAAVEEEERTALGAALEKIGATTMELAQRGMAGDRDGMLAHSVDYLEAFSIVVVAWQWARMAAAARRGLERDRASADFYRGKLAAARWFFANELVRVPALCDICLTDTSFVEARPEWF
jgi:alkylation response protein AidB-like acyl-CoA dehydrogenase